MGFIQRCFLRNNNQEILDKLKDLGYHICICCNFKDAVWLSTLPVNGTVHGIGYSDEIRLLPVEQELELFLCQKSDDEIDCGENLVLFYFIAALRDDTDDKQVFTNGKGDWAIYHDDGDDMSLSGFEFMYMSKDNNTDNYHKASVEELKSLFGNE